MSAKKYEKLADTQFNQSLQKDIQHKDERDDLIKLLLVNSNARPNHNIEKTDLVNIQNGIVANIAKLQQDEANRKAYNDLMDQANESEKGLKSKMLGK
jgi:hypothetical protein